MKRVIISGADGFVGSNTVKCFLSNNIEVLALDIHDRPKNLPVDCNLKYLKCDITDIVKLKQSIPIDYYDTFIHFAWAGSSGVARTDYNLQIKNALTTVECMKTAKELGCRRFVCAGSIMEYEVEFAVHAQGSMPSMGYIYGMGKHIAHCLCKSVAVDIGIELVWPMITNAYGVGEISPRFINTTLRKMINNEPLQFTSGTQNYDFVYVTDVANAFYLISKNGKAFSEYVIGSGHAKQLREFIIEMKQSCSPNSELLFGDIPFTGTNLPLATFDTTNTEKDTGFVPKISFTKGTKLTMDWLKTIND